MNATKQDNLEPIVNRIANSGIETINLADYLPKTEILEIDIKDFLFQGLLLKEKDFRAHLNEHQWQKYNDKIVAVFCSTDALVQQWAYMLITSNLGNAKDVIFGTKDEVKEQLLVERLRNLKVQDFEDKRVMVRGCGDEKIESSAYLAITNKLLPVVKSLFYGEACSNVPIYKKKK